MSATSKRLSVLIPRWAGRGLGLLLAVLVATIAVGEALGPSTPRALTAREILMACLFVVALAGLLIGWRWETVGGALVLGGMTSFFVAHFAFTGRVMSGWALYALALPGALFLIAAWRSRYVQSSGAA